MLGWRFWAAMGGMLRLVVVAVVITLAGWFVVAKWGEHARVSEQRALDSRLFDLTTRAIAPGSALACLDALAGETVELACEKALFASPETVAAAVSYMAAQVTLLSASKDRAPAGNGSALAPVRRAIESDRFGIAAHILAVREGCTAEQCGAFALLDDPTRVRANIAAQTFDALVQRHAAAWPGSVPAAASAATPAPASPASSPVASARNPNNLFFPSASSIPPVSIMNAEPGIPQDTTGSADATKPARRPLPPARPPAQGGAASSAPLPLAPAQP